MEDSFEIEQAESATADEDLIAAYYARNDEAFATLFDKWFPHLVRKSLGFEELRNDAEDLAIETLFKVARTRERGSRFDRNKSSFTSWIIKIHFNAKISALRARATQPRTTDSTDSGSSSDEGAITNNLRLGTDTELSLCVRGTLMTLREADRLLLELHYVDGLPYEAIAEILEVSEGTVASRLFSARREFKDRWNE